jgi:hypothetical protein
MGIGSRLLSLGDLLDEWRARRARRLLGEERWIVSWARDESDARKWRARLSCSRFPLTLERRGRTRLEAIRKAAEALGSILASN